jgi:hypothetical protein
LAEQELLVGQVELFEALLFGQVVLFEAPASGLTVDFEPVVEELGTFEVVEDWI